ncbi:hypothetical protein H6F74_13480 [Trichocoleus sp. FACHB-90]|uniref:muconolactone Delta-isomerase family protein n=1 Tax=Cyanophyceae TaxID=3028117 RepID=UPI0016882618|nr:muconolactone Delta-isomerase family protein [Trichocoleus sp. FACHB-90]MBD1927247.1 hypothetical protein [Trichocoleus sp. FACHB-90]
MQFLVIARVFEGVSTEQVFPLVKPEVAQAWEYYAADLVRTIHYIADQSGAVLLFEADSLEIVNEAVAQFPMVKAGFLKVEVLPLKPYVGIAELFSAQG